MVLFGNVQISTQAVETLVQQEVPVTLLTRYGRFIGALTPAPSKNVMLRVHPPISGPLGACCTLQFLVGALTSGHATGVRHAIR